MDQLISFFVGPGDSRLGAGDSFTDRLNCRYTVFFLSILAVGVTGLQWLGHVPIACWCPSDFTDSQVEFANRACWTQNAYFLPLTELHIPNNPKSKQYISYYQWVALVLVSQAVLFYLPQVLWKCLGGLSGISVSTVTDACVQYQMSTDEEKRERIRFYIVKHMGRYFVEISRSELVATRLKNIWIWLYGNSLIIIYCMIKLVYLGNIIGQIFLMNKFLGTQYYMYGFKVMGKMFRGENWSTSDRFPRIALCDLQIRRLGNIHNYTIQCSLPLNLFNEIIYISVWFWFIFVAVCIIISLILWIWHCAFVHRQLKYITNRLIALNKLTADDDAKTIDKFVRLFLRRDGIFMIRLISKNTSDVIAAAIIVGLYDHFKDNINIVLKLNRKELYKSKKSELKRNIQHELNHDISGNSDDVLRDSTSTVNTRV